MKIVIQRTIIMKLVIQLAITLLVLVGGAVSAEESQTAVADQITPAPGQGVITGLSDHSAVGSPFLFKFDALPVEELSTDTSRQYIHGIQSTLTKWTFKKGATVGVHYHPMEQVSWIVSGRAEVFSNGKKYVLNAGDVIVIPPNVPHEFRYPIDTINIDFFAPVRQDWIDGKTTYLPK